MAGFPIEVATRIKTLPPYLFAAIDKMKQEALARGVDIINLGIGDPDLPTPAPIIESLYQAAKNPKHHQYPSYEGMLSFRKAVADWYKRLFNVTLDPANEVLTLIGSKEGMRGGKERVSFSAEEIAPEESMFPPVMLMPISKGQVSRFAAYQTGPWHSTDGR